MNKQIRLKAFAIGLLALLLMAFLFATNRNKPVFNDSDLIFSRAEVPLESNAFWTLSKATNELYWPTALEHKLGDLSNNTNWDDSLARNILRTNRLCLDLFDESLRQPFLLVPEPNTVEDDYPYLESWRVLSRIEAIQAIALSRAQQGKSAIDTAMKIIKFGQRAENAGGGIYHYLVASSIKAAGLRLIRQIIAHTTLEDADLLALLRRLDDFRPNKEGLTNALKVEYEKECNYLDNIAGPKKTNSAPGKTLAPFGLLGLFNPIKTKMEFAQSARFFRDNISKPYGEIPRSDVPVLQPNRPTWKLFIKGNAIGDILFEMQNSTATNISSRKSREDVEVTATQLLLAVKIYKIRHGKLPESLSELVPEYFPQVPVDDFSGKPFFYSRDKKLIYSVGPGLKDLGGADFHKDSNSYNLPFKIEF